MQENGRKPFMQYLRDWKSIDTMIIYRLERMRKMVKDIVMNVENRVSKIWKMVLILSALAVMAVCLFYSANDGLWMLPLVYAACFWGVISVKKVPCCNIAVIIILAILYIRDVILPFFYYEFNSVQNIDISAENAAYLQCYSTNLFHNVSVITIMSLETIAIFGTLYFCSKRYTKRNLEQEGEEAGQMQRIGVVAVPFILAGIIVFLRQPRNSGIYDMIHNLWWDFVPSSMESILFDVATVLLAVVLINYVGVIGKQKCGIAFSVSVIIWLTFCVEAAVGTLNAGTISRWAFVINFIIGYAMLLKMYPQYTKIFTLVMGIGGAACIVLSSVVKSYSINDLLTYRMLNAYFAGPSGMAYAVEMVKSGNYDINIVTLFCDMLGNVPVINHFLPEKISSVRYYNQVIYGNTITIDQIIPYSGEWYGYFSYAGVVLGNVVSCFWAIKFAFMVRKEKNLLMVYALMYISVLFSICTIININIVFQYLSIRVFPIFVIACADKLISKLIKGRINRGSKCK